MRRGSWRHGRRAHQLTSVTFGLEYRRADRAGGRRVRIGQHSERVSVASAHDGSADVDVDIDIGVSSAADRVGPADHDDWPGRASRMDVGECGIIRRVHRRAHLRLRRRWSRDGRAFSVRAHPLRAARREPRSADNRRGAWTERRTRRRSSRDAEAVGGVQRRVQDVFGKRRLRAGRPGPANVDARKGEFRHRYRRFGTRRSVGSRPSPSGRTGRECPPEFGTAPTRRAARPEHLTDRGLGGDVQRREHGRASARSAKMPAGTSSMQPA